MHRKGLIIEILAFAEGAMRSTAKTLSKASKACPYPADGVWAARQPETVLLMSTLLAMRR